MRTILLILTTFLIFGFSQNPTCGDGKVYANKDQTEHDKRFESYPKIDEVPKYKGGSKKLDKLIRSKLKLSEFAKNQIFNLNYQFTVTCEGKIKDVKEIGKSKTGEWTNIVEIMQDTDVSWTPAQKDGKTVDCIYFSTLFINGSKY